MSSLTARGWEQWDGHPALDAGSPVSTRGIPVRAGRTSYAGGKLETNARHPSCLLLQYQR